MNRINNLKIWSHDHLPSEVSSALERLARAEDVVHVAVLPDVHLAKDVCVGTAIATSTTLYPAAVGGDIGCGMAAVQLSGGADALESEHVANEILAAVGQAVPILRHPQRRQLPDELRRDQLSDGGLRRKQARLAGHQLGSLGRGNHFVELQADEDNGLWLMVHSGSRGIGQAIRDHHLQQASRRRGGLMGLDADSDEAAAYLSDLKWALRYAATNRRRIIQEFAGVLEAVLGATPLPGTEISCHHNSLSELSWQDQHVWVHRKGAISARQGEAGVIPGSMGSASYHVVGRGCEAALQSSSHGAGRSLSRSAARARVRIPDLHRQMEGIWFDRALSHRLRDEAPSVYKDIAKVMAAQRELTAIVRTLRPVLVFKGG